MNLVSPGPRYFLRLINPDSMTALRMPLKCWCSISSFLFLRTEIVFQQALGKHQLTRFRTNVLYGFNHDVRGDGRHPVENGLDDS